jgi:hypothetical protein
MAATSSPVLEMDLGRTSDFHSFITSLWDTGQLVQALLDHLDRSFVQRNCLLARPAAKSFIPSRERYLVLQPETHLLTTFP